MAKTSFNFEKPQVKEEWLTPPELVRALGPFDLDPCAPASRPWDTASRHVSLPQDGLAIDWQGRVWLNPPYGNKTFLWMRRLADHGSGTGLTFARTETRGFHEQVWDRATAVFFFRDRLSFYHSDGTKGERANAPSCLIAYSDRDAEKIEEAQKVGAIAGKFVYLGGKR